MRKDEEKRREEKRRGQKRAAQRAAPPAFSRRGAPSRPGPRVAMLPTFVGCPALDVIRGSIEAALAETGLQVVVEPTFDVPWTSDRISARGRAALGAVGIAPPSEPADVRCPRCASAEVVLDGLFGPTQCRSLYYCRGCRQPFEAMKPV